MIKDLDEAAMQTGMNKRAGVWAFFLMVLFGAFSGAVCRSELLSLQAPILYPTTKSEDPIARLQKRIDAGQVKLEFEKGHGYLVSVLKAMEIPVSSQTLVFSKTSFQRDLIAPWRPRALYFNDDTYVGWVQSGPVLEFAAVDKHLGAVFYTLDQEPAAKPQFRRQGMNCLQCHEGGMTNNIPGLVVRSAFTEAGGNPMLTGANYLTTPASPFEQRWGGWYVTGNVGNMRHMGNLVVHKGENPDRMDLSHQANTTDLSTLFDTNLYLSSGSDVVALMVLTHQTQMHNLMTAADYQTRIALRGSPEGAAPNDAARKRIDEACEPLVREMLFCGEAPLTGAVVGSSTFAHDFSAAGTRDGQGRSLRDFDLTRRLFKYPCSYLIYSDSFTALPAPAREYIFRRIGDVLSGKEKGEDFAHLTAEDRENLSVILRQTVPGFH